MMFKSSLSDMMQRSQDYLADVAQRLGRLAWAEEELALTQKRLEYYQRENFDLMRENVRYRDAIEQVNTACEILHKTGQLTITERQQIVTALVTLNNAWQDDLK